MKKLILLVALLASAGAVAADEDANVIKVNGVKNPDMRSYRSIVAGLDAFDAHHQLAPSVPEVRFRLEALPQHELNLPSLSLRIVGNGDPIPLAFAADGTFAVPRNQAALDDKADLVLNRKKGELQGRPVIRTPGLPDNVMRLGDLRLTCEVEIAVVKSEMNFLVRAALSTVLLTSDWCNVKMGQFWFKSHGVLTDAAIVEGERREEIKFQRDGYAAPIGDSRWSDEARIELKLEPESGKSPLL